MLVVNHGPGLFDGYNPELSEGETTTDLLSALIGAYAKYNLRSVIYMHSMLDRDNADMFPRQQYALQFPIPVVTTIESAARHFNIPRLEHGMQPIAVPSAATPPNAPQAYDAASQRTARYAKSHSMLESVPRLATALPSIVSDYGFANFVSPSTFCAFSLLGLDPAQFKARVAYALGGNGAEEASSALSGDAHSPERAAVLGHFRRHAPNKLQANFPVVVETQYWREHYEIEEFLFGTTGELLFAAHRAILKRDPQLVDFDIGSSAAVEKRPTGREILELLGRLIRGHHELEFTPRIPHD